MRGVAAGANPVIDHFPRSGGAGLRNNVDGEVVFVEWRTDARAEVHDEIRGLDAEPALQERDGRAGDIRRGAGPTGMGQTDGTPPPIGNENGGAISHVDAESKAALRGDQSIDPGMRSGGGKCERLVEFVDMYPTLCEACGVTPPEGLEGLSLLPLVENPERQWKKAAFSQFPRPYPAKDDWTEMGYTMRTERYRYTEWFDRGKNLLARELYDYEIAPTETVNLAGRPEHAGLVERLARQLHAGWKEALR